MWKKGEEVKKDTKEKIYQSEVQFGKRNNTRLSALTFFVK